MLFRSEKVVAIPSNFAVHPAKLLGIATTFSFPTQRQIAFYASPRVTVGLLCGLLAALTHVAILTFG